MRHRRISLAIKISVLVMAVSFVGISTLAYFSYNMTKEIFIENTTEVLAKKLENYEYEILNSIKNVQNSVELLSFNPSVLGFFRALTNRYHYDEINNKTLNQYRNELLTLFYLLLKQNEEFFQIRLLDLNGNELIKVIKNNKKIIIVPQSRLQNKAHREYFIEGIKLKKDSIYLSNIDLNKEHGGIEFPIKPTIRAAKIIQINNKKAGVVIINVDVSKLFKFTKLKRNRNEYIYISNKDGYYIFNGKDPSKEFGFEFGYDYRIYHDFPQIKKLFKSKKLREISFFDSDTNNIFIAKKMYITPDRYLVLLGEISTAFFQKKADIYVKNLVSYIVIITVIITLITILAVKKLTLPIIKLTKIAKEIAKTEGKKPVNITVRSNDEIGELAKAFKTMLLSLIKSQKKLEKFAEELEKEVEEKTKELRKLNENLQKEVQRQVEEIREKDQALVHQAKLAAMGEMIGAIAHQWRQPINYLALNIQLLQQFLEEENYDEKEIKETLNKMLETIKFMSNTIDDFRTFFRKDKEATVFDVKEAVEKTLELLKPQLEHRNIKIDTKLEPVKVKGFKNEFRQVILNLIANSRDAITQRMKEENIQGKLYIEVKKENNYAVVIIRDNGGGIPEEIADRIFEPYFTTKEEGHGTGMGLYMSKQIIERMGGEIYFKNVEDGVEFIIKIKAVEQ
ncbi:ATP-binding protein [Persephonella sp.]